VSFAAPAGFDTDDARMRTRSLIAVRRSRAQATTATGTSTVPTSAGRPAISSPTVPCPRRSTDGRTAAPRQAFLLHQLDGAIPPVLGRRPCQLDARAEPLGARALGRRHVVGITATEGTPNIRAAIATACAWLPDDGATTPRRRSSSLSCARKLYAPRT
jgi:hypothetical protein